MKVELNSVLRSLKVNNEITMVFEDDTEENVSRDDMGYWAIYNEGVAKYLTDEEMSEKITVLIENGVLSFVY